MSTYDHESKLLGMVMRYGEKAAEIAFPYLSSDSFIHNFSGGFGTEHAEVWDAIHKAYIINQLPPVLAHVQNENNALALRALIKRLEDQYGIYDFDAKTVEYLVNVVDKSGVVYKLARKANALSHVVDNVNTFSDVVSDIDDIEVWANDQIAAMQRSLAIKQEGYTSIADAIKLRREYWRLAASGENVALLPNGIPSLMKNRLFPRGTLSVMHGVSGTGKSTFAMQVALGVAMSLKANNVPGCVAINSLEMTQGSLVDVLSSTLARVNTAKFVDGTVKPDELQRIEAWADVVQKLPIFIDDTSFITTTAMQYRSNALNTSEHGPVVMLVSDYGELFSNDAPTEELRVSNVFRSQFGLSRLLDVAVLAISQSTNNSGNNSGIAGADGTRYSRGPLMAADILVELANYTAMKHQQRNVVIPESLLRVAEADAYLLIEKYRNSATGGIIPFGWRGEHTAFWDLGIPQVAGKEKYFNNISTVLEALGFDPEKYGIKPSVNMSNGGSW